MHRIQNEQECVIYRHNMSYIELETSVACRLIKYVTIENYRQMICVVYSDGACDTELSHCINAMSTMGINLL